MFARGTVKGDPGPWGVSYLQRDGQRAHVGGVFQEGVGAVEGGPARRREGSVVALQAQQRLL